MKTQKVKISEVKMNPNNPNRTTQQYDMNTLFNQAGYQNSPTSLPGFTLKIGG